ncbi:hypothetical protein HHI36_023389 [Cryptolaemus montrouzieri]|uniref:RUN domain-containing protein n=1 Tax=Cryptolaemus montrouzieri TaxID=559131 RepID=A0ABD2PHW6_9CUCU
MDSLENMYSSETSPEEQPTGKRWDPLGAPNDQDIESNAMEKFDYHCCDHSSSEKIQNLEEEQELLNSSLFALTTHFAQVQFRLKQVVSAPPEDREELLKSLEEFAFRGIPDVGLVQERMDEASLAEAVRLRRTQQRELIDRLKSQLRELEQYAFENGDSAVPQDVVLERQRVILNELKTRMNLEIDEQKYLQMTPADVKEQINLALDQLVSPLRVKEHLVAQLKTQVADLERFISYLQTDTKQAKCSCGCSYHSVKKPFNTDTIGLIQRTATLLQMFAVLQLGCGPQKFKKNDLKNTKVNHYGDLRAKLEMAIAHVRELVIENSKHKQTQGEYSSDSESGGVKCNVQLTRAVRKYLATSIRDLIQHGSMIVNHSSSIVPFMGCFPRRGSGDHTHIHAWELILEYYELKNGENFNSTPARKLSQSFNLDIAGSSPINSKQTMLSAIGSIISTHTKYKRSNDSHFKAFICAGLNSNKLVSWLNHFFQCTPLIKAHYQPWSYVAKTGFKDSLSSLDTLTGYKFDLPVDLAVQQFQNIKDVFT